MPLRNKSLSDIAVKANSDMMYAGVVTGNNPGAVWADDITNPTFCLVWSEYLKAFHFMGSCYAHINKDEFQKFIESTIISFLKKRNIGYFEFACDNEEWIAIICEMLSNYELKQSKQFVYKQPHKNNINTSMPCTVGYAVFEINESFISNRFSVFENYEETIADIERAWGELAKFLEFGKGFIAAQNNRICSFAYTSFLFENTYSIGVETYETHKKKGLSSFLS